MDPVTHTMTGALLAATGWRRRTALATPTAIIAANIPDIDVLSYVNGEYAALAFRRGWTHGPPALVVLTLFVVLLMLAWDRFVRRRRHADATPARAAPLLVLAALAALTHPLLDWMNTYGIRWLMPFDRQWYYGDSLFIIDPWIWLLLGVPLFLLHSRRPGAIVAWAAFALAATALVAGTGAVPLGGTIIWLAAVGAAVVLRLRRPHGVHDAGDSGMATAALGATAIYIAGMVASSAAAAPIVARVAGEAGIEIQRVMVAPAPGNPFRAGVVVQDNGGYWTGRFSWFDSPRARLSERPVPAGSFDSVAIAAAAVPAARDYLSWSRFPIVDSRATESGFTVRFRDARYLDGAGSGSLSGVTIQLDAALRPLP